MVELGSKGEVWYLAVIGDLRGSRDLPDRAALQRRLSEGLVELGAALGSNLAASFVLTLGDEFQGLLRCPGAALGAIVELESILGRISLRYGLGWGPLATELRPQAIGMDGPCFHAARDALERAKKEQRWAVAAGFGERGDRVLNGVLSLLGEVRAGWTDRQAEAVAARRRADTLKEAAEALAVKEPTLHKALKGAHYAALRETEQALKLLLEDLGRAAT